MATALRIPLSAIPAQQFKVRLNNQDCTIRLYQRRNDFYFDLYVDDDVPVRVGILIFVQKPILVDVSEEEFQGQFYLVDTVNPKSPKNPVYEGLGDRWKLAYIYD